MSRRHELVTKISSLFYAILTDCVSLSLNHEAENNMPYSTTNNNITNLPLSISSFVYLTLKSIPQGHTIHRLYIFSMEENSAYAKNFQLQLIIGLHIFDLLEPN